MLEVRDPAIKLFGKTIPVAGDGDGDGDGEESRESSNCSDHQETEKELAEEGSMETDQPDDTLTVKEESADPPPVSESNENQKEPDSENQNQEEPDSEKDSETPQDEKAANDPKNSQQKPMKKPDKIVPCPRCNSMDTKFCYYNNYNINQPRHFCKSCQRYWTAGGTMRNVPVGAGRRKNKSSASRYAHMTVSEALQAAHLDVPNGVHPSFKTNGTVLTFGSDTPLCESMASVLNIADNKVLNATPRNGFHNIAPVIQVACPARENGDERSSGLTVTTTSSKEDGLKKGPQEPIKQPLNGFSNQMPCFQWPFMWNPAVPVPPFCPSGFPMPLYPAPYWNGAIPWNVPWVPPCSPGSPGQKSPGSKPNSPTLGKHSREGEMLKPNENEKNSGTTVLVPKTLRIDDPDEAAKSSIWTTLGILKEKGDSTSKGGFFNSFQSKPKEKDHSMETSPELKANPAALCRSADFQERA